MKDISTLKLNESFVSEVQSIIDKGRECTYNPGYPDFANAFAKSHMEPFLKGLKGK